MGKQQKSKAKISDLLPRAAGPVTFLSPPPSPARVNSRKGSPSPKVSLIPKDIRRKPRTLSFDAREPTSPKVSCMGKVKNRKKNKIRSNPTKLNPILSSSLSWRGAIMNLFRGKQKEIQGSDKVSDRSPTTRTTTKASSLSQVKKFTSGRNVLQDFDWKAHAVGASADVESNCLQADKIEDEEKDIATCSESVALEPRREINLWKKRSLSPPRPLQV